MHAATTACTDYSMHACMHIRLPFNMHACMHACMHVWGRRSNALHAYKRACCMHDMFCMHACMEDAWKTCIIIDGSSHAVSLLLSMLRPPLRQRLRGPHHSLPQALLLLRASSRDASVASLGLSTKRTYTEKRRQSKRRCSYSILVYISITYIICVYICIRIYIYVYRHTEL